MINRNEARTRMKKEKKKKYNSRYLSGVICNEPWVWKRAATTNPIFIYEKGEVTMHGFLSVDEFTSFFFYSLMWNSKPHLKTFPQVDSSL